MGRHAHYVCGVAPRCLLDAARDVGLLNDFGPGDDASFRSPRRHQRAQLADELALLIGQAAVDGIRPHDMQ